MISLKEIALRSGKMVGKAVSETGKATYNGIKTAKEKYKDNQEKKQFILDTITQLEHFEAEVQYKMELRHNDILNICEKSQRSYKHLLEVGDKLCRLAIYFNNYVPQAKSAYLKTDKDINIKLFPSKEELTIGEEEALAKEKKAKATNVETPPPTLDITTLSPFKGGTWLAVTLTKLAKDINAAGGTTSIGGASFLHKLFTKPLNFIYEEHINSYEDAIDVNEQLHQANIVLHQRLEELELIYQDFVKLNYLLHASNKLLLTCCLVLELARSNKQHPRLDNLLACSAKLINDFSISIIVTDLGEYNTISETTLASLYEQMEDINQQIGHFAGADTGFKALNKSYIKEPIKHLSEDILQQYIFTAFKEAQQEICLNVPGICNWLTYNKQGLYDILRETLKRGINIKVMYDLPTDHSIATGLYQETLDNIRFMKKNLENYKGNIIFKEQNAPYRILICDDKFYILSSYNYMNFQNTTTPPERRFLQGDLGEDVDLLLLHKQIFDL